MTGPESLSVNISRNNHESIAGFSLKLVDNLPVAIYTCDKYGYVTAYNKASVALWGRKPEIGKDLWCGSWKIYHTDGNPMDLDTCPMARTLKEGVAVEGEEIVIERPDGTRRFIRPYPVPSFDSSGVLTGAINTLIDITGQKAEDEKQSTLAAIIESSDDAIISKTLDGIITSWNNGAERIFGYSEEEMIGKHISKIIPGDRLNEESIIISKVRRGEKVDHFETLRLGKNGIEIPISLTVSAIKNSDGKIVDASKIARDVSEQKNARDTIQKLFEEIKTLNNKKDEFIGLASHELKTPVTTTSAYLQILEKNLKDDDKNRQFAVKALQQVKKLSGLISDLLDVSKIESGKLPLSYSRFDVIELINEVVEIVQYGNKTHKIQLNCDLKSLNIHADRQRIEQVIINLLSNAIKYSPIADNILLSVSGTNEEISFSVKDFGIGIREDQQSRIFSRFYRVDDLASHMSGLGIGLYISHEIITRHNGVIWVESQYGSGSTFHFKIPVGLSS